MREGREEERRGDMSERRDEGEEEQRGTDR